MMLNKCMHTYTVKPPKTECHATREMFNLQSNTDLCFRQEHTISLM